MILATESTPTDLISCIISLFSRRQPILANTYTLRGRDLQSFPIESAPSSAARSFNPDSFALAQTSTESPRHLLHRAVLAHDESLARRAVCSSGQTPRPA